MNEIDVSLCMIVKNEEEMLERCLRSVGDAVQEIVIVDTGSTDRTVEIARRHHARVASFAWCDDFAAARNASLALARGRFVLVLDADEELTPETPALIARAVRDPEASGFYMAFENPCDEGQVLRFLIVRLFVNHPDVRFENRIHEQVWPSLERLGSRTGRKLKLLPGALIRHAGYRPELMAKRGKIERNLRLFERQLDERPDDLYTWYKYGDFLRSTPRKSEALLAIGKARTLLHALAPERAQRCSFAIEIGTLYALELYERGRYHEAHEARGEDRRRYQNSPNSDYVMAGVALKIGKLDEAQELFRRCLAAHGAPMFNARRDGITTYLAMTGLGSVAAARGDLPEASRWFERALASEPECESALAALAGCHFQAGKLGEAIGVLAASRAAAAGSTRLAARRVDAARRRHGGAGADLARSERALAAGPPRAAGGARAAVHVRGRLPCGEAELRGAPAHARMQRRPVARAPDPRRAGRSRDRREAEPDRGLAARVHRHAPALPEVRRRDRLRRAFAQAGRSLARTGRRARAPARAMAASRETVKPGVAAVGRSGVIAADMGQRALRERSVAEELLDKTSAVER
ncbi:MAG: glycosyltransferase [Planctomycetota bacterium]